MSTNNAIIFDGSPNVAGPLSSQGLLQMQNSQTFNVGNFGVGTYLNSGSNIYITSTTGSNATSFQMLASWAGTETNISINNVNGAREIDMKSDTLKMTGSLNVSGSNADHKIIGERLFLTASLLVSSSLNHEIVGNQLNITGNTNMVGNSGFPLTVDGTINSKRLHFSSNPFNNDPSSNLGAVRFDATNQVFYSTNYDIAEITSQSMVYQSVVTGSNRVETGLRSNNNGFNYNLSLINQSGTGSLVTDANVIVTGSLTVTGSASITGYVQGNVNALAVSSNTASLNLNNGNFFVLALTGSQDIRIEPSNIKAGQTINVLLNTTGSGTVSFPTSIKQVSGSAYVPTTAVGNDIITLVSFDTSSLYLANVKNLV
jgi:hypothetical protein